MNYQMMFAIITSAARFCHSACGYCHRHVRRRDLFHAIKLKSKLGYDDTLDVFGVNGVGGIGGALATGLFASIGVKSVGADGLFSEGGLALLGKQIARALGSCMRASAHSF